jgi:hypothetical protein
MVLRGDGDDGASKVGILVGATPSSHYSADIMARALDIARIPYTTVVDPTGDVAAAKIMAGSVDGIGLAMSQSSLLVVLSALRRGGYAERIGVCACAVNAAVGDALGVDGEGIFVSSQTAFVTDTTNPGVAAYLADLKAYGPKDSPAMDLGVLAWSGVKLFAAIAASLGEVDAQTFRKAADALDTPVDIGTIAPWQTVGRASPVGDWPRIVNPFVQVGILRSGVPVPDGKGFIDPFAVMSKVGTG